MTPGSVVQSRRREEYQILGLIAVLLSLAGIAVISLAAPWPLRFAVVAVAALYGPAIPLLRMSRRLSLGECLVYGIGVNVSMQMLLGFGLVLGHIWVPVDAFMGVLVVSLLAGTKLLFDGRIQGA